MIVKLKSHKRPIFKQLLNYMINGKDRLFDKENKSFCISHNLKGNSIDEWTKQFQTNELKRLRKRKDSVRITHEILSWHKDDAKHITIEKLNDIAKEYIKQRNPIGLYVAVPHFDKDHYHIHICASGVENKTGRSLRLSKADLSKLKKNIQQYQISRYPELSKSVVAHGKDPRKRVTDREYHFKSKAGRETDKEQLIGILKTCYKKASSPESFYSLLKECGLSTYERSKKVTGVLLNGRKFRFSRLGFSEERIMALDLTLKRSDEIKKLRSLKRGGRIKEI
jgi:hypothetical protein